VNEHSEQGVVTLMFTDVEGSTALATAHGDEEARRLVEAQREVVRAEVTKHGGREIDSIGDGFMLSFNSTRKAITCAVAIQQALESEPMRVRIGLNAGEVIDKAGHPFGGAVNAAARVASNAKGGEILVSDAVRQLAGTMPGVSFRDRGRFRLKGFPEPWRLYEVVKGDEGLSPRRARRLAILLGAAGLVVLATALALLFTRGGTSAPPSGEGVTPKNDPPTLVPGESIGGVKINMTEDDVTQSYRAPGAAGSWAGKGKTGTYATYSLHGTPLRVYYFDNKVVSVSTTSPYYRSDDGIAVGILAPTTPQLVKGQRTWRGFRFKCFSYRASGGAAETVLGLLIPLGGLQQHSHVSDITIARTDFLTDAADPPAPFVSQAAC
jgi:class 3 adenylate cyclase